MKLKPLVVLACLLVGLLPVSLGLLAPPQAAPRVQATPTDTSGLGPSVDISYQPANKLWDESTLLDIEGSVDNWYMYLSRQYAYEADGQECHFVGDFSNVSSWEFYVHLLIYSPYQSVNLVDFDWRISVIHDGVGTLINAIYCYTDAVETNIDSNNALDTWSDGSTAITSAHCVDEIVHLSLRSKGWGFSDVIQVDIQLDELVVEYASLAETRRSTYSVQGGTVRYAVDWTTWDYNTETTLSPPTAWTFQDVNPAATESSNVFSCLVPENFEAVYTCDVLATANWLPYWSDTTENMDTAGAYTTIEAEYVIVLDGSLSTHWVHDDPTYFSYEDSQLLPDGNYTAVFSIYHVAGATNLRFYEWKGSWSYTGTTVTTGEWKTFLVNIDVAGSTGGRNWMFYCSMASGTEAYVDGVTFYQSSVDTGSTVTGTANHVYPNGATVAAFFEFNYNCTTWFATDTAKLTGSDGTWSIATSGWSLASGTQTFYTCNPDDVDDYTSDSITYPFTVTVDTTLWMVFRRGTGQIIPWGTFICMVDNETRPEPYAAVTGSTTTGTSLTVNVTLVDDFGQLVYQNTSYPVNDTGHTFLRETLNVYILNLANQRNKPQYAVVTRNGDTWQSPDIGAYNSFPYLVYGSVSGVSYTVTWYRAEDGAVTDTLAWTVYTSDITAYSGWDIPIVIPPGIDPEPLIYAIQSTFFWTSFLQIIFILGGLVVLGVVLRRRGPTIPTVGAPEEDAKTDQDDISPPLIEEEDVRKRGEEARKTRGKMTRRR